MLWSVSRHPVVTAPIKLACFAINCLTHTVMDELSGERELLTDMNDTTVADLLRPTKIGVTNVVGNFHHSTMEMTSGGMRNFMEEIAPAGRGFDRLL